MRNTMLTYIDRFMHDRHSRKVLGSVLLVLAIVVSLTVYWQLRLHGIAITNETYCGYEEHVHTEECYETTLICGLEETVGLTSDWHTHNESCYDEEGNLVCELEECEPHTHTDECYETTLVCEIPEHTHTSDCLVDLEADVEDATVWEATLPELAGDLRTDIVNIAYSQLGYTESTANYTLADDGTTKMGYTRYGAWYGGLYYGSEYSDWDSLFVAFCLDYAGIAEDFTYNSGAYAWSVDLTALGYYQTADSYAPSIGDVAFIDTDADGRANVTAVVVSVDKTAQTITVIQGNYTVTDSEGNSTDTVAVVTYSTATEIATQNEIVALSAGSEAEITPVVLGYANVTYVNVTYVPEAEKEAEEITIDEEETAELIEEEVEEITVDETEADETETEEAEETEEETVLLTTASAVLTYDEYCSEAYSLYTYAMSVTDSTVAATAWDSFMTLWDEIDSAYADGTLTDEEYESLNDIMYGYYDEVYAYYTESVGYDPYDLITADENGEELNSNSTSLNLADLSNITWSYNKVSYSEGEFDISFHIDFETLSKSSITSESTFYITLLDGIEIPEDYTKYTYTGYDSSNNAAFTFTFEKNDSGEWQIVIDFNDSYDSDDQGTVSGYFDFSGTYTLNDGNIDDNGDIVIGGTGGATITIDADDVTTDDDENWLGDITVTKSATGYNTSTKSITYTVVVSSENGTNGKEITLEDIISIVNNSTYDNTKMSVKSVTIDSVKYYTTNYGGWWQIGESTLTKSDSASTTSTYVVDSTSTSDLSITLGALLGKDANTDSTSTGDCYVITYTVYFDSESGEYNSSISNSATASSTTDAGEIKDTSTVTKNAIDSSISKKGVYDSSTNTITWTITFNSSNSNIAGYTIYDDAFAETTDLLINGESSSTNYDWEFVYDTSDPKNITGIKFNAITASEAGGTPDTNINSYTITYTTSAETYLGSEGYTSRNTVTVKNKDDKEQAKEYGDVWVGTGGSLHKTLSSAGSMGTYTTTKNGTQVTIYTRVLSWETTVNVPAGGITKGTVLEDYLGQWGGDTSSYTNTASTEQWFTYTQITTLFKSLADEGIKIGDNKIAYEDTGKTDSDGNAIYTFTLEAYDATTGEWVKYSNISDNGDLYTAYRITFNADYDYSGTWTIKYSTTADITQVQNNDETKEYYNNYVKIGNLSADAGYTEQSLVYKTDGKYNLTNSDTSVDSTGTLTWIVNVYIEAGSDKEYVITDTLPAGLSFVSAKIATSSDSATLLVSEADNGKITAYWANNETGKDTDANYGIVATIETVEDATNGDYEVMEITLDSTDYSWLTSNGGYVTITYTVTINDFDDITENYTIGEPNNVGSYKNSVVVTYGGSDYGEDDQTQNVTYTKTEEGGSTDTDRDVVTKSGQYVGSSGELQYSVLLNPDAKNINESGDYLTFTDTAQHWYAGTDTDWHTALLSFIDSSLLFYRLDSITVNVDGNGTYVDSNGNTQTISNVASASNVYTDTSTGETLYYYKEELEDIVWTYSATTTALSIGESGNYYYTITATVPDEMAILVEYKYNIAAAHVSDGFEISNSATLSYDGTSAGSDGKTERDNWEKVTIEAGITSGSGVTIYKVATNSYSTKLPDAKFEMWKYKNGTWTRVTQDEFASGYTDSSDPTGTDVTNKNTLPIDSDNYLITDSNGTISISSMFEYLDGSNKAYAYYDWFEEDTLYYIVEVEAPDEYELITQQKIYFYWSSDNSSGITYPSDFDASSNDVYDLNATSLNTTVYLENQPNTTFTLTKVSTTDTGLTLAGATFALYEYHDESYKTSDEGTWIRIGTYVTDSNGEITITFNDQIYTFNYAYKLVEESSPDDYNIAYNDDAAFYFYWGSSDNTTYPPVLPSDWASGTTGTSASEALNIATSDGEVTATNTKNTTTIAVKKAWVDEAGNDLSSSDYSATVELYYYLADKNGDPIRDTSSTAKYITLSSSTSDTTAEVFSRTALNLTLENDKWTEFGLASTSIQSLLSAVYNECYNDAYVEVVVVGGAKPASMPLVLQYNDYNKYIYISPSSVDSETDNTSATATYTVRYSVEDIKKALSNADIDYSTVCGICLDGQGYGGQGKVQSISVEVPMNVSKTDSTASSAFLSTYTDSNGEEKEYTWNTRFYGSDYASAVSTPGAVLEVSYSGATANTQVRVGIQDGSNSYVTAVTLPSTEGVVYVALSDLENYSSIEWDTYAQTFIQAITWNSDTSTNTSEGTTITGVRLLVPSESTTSTTYEVYETQTTPSRGDTTLTSDYTTYFQYDSSAAAALATDGALICVNYTAGETLPSYLALGIQFEVLKDGSTTEYIYPSDTLTITSKVTADTTGEIYIAVSDIEAAGSYNLDNNKYNTVFLNISENDQSTVTINSVTILTPYSADTSISPNLSSNVVLYNPSTSSYNTSLQYGSYQYNALSSREDEDEKAEYDDSNITDRDSVVFSGYGFLDAVYSNVADSVVFTLSGVKLSTSNYIAYDGSTADVSDILKTKLRLIIQGDLSADYGEILSVTPTNVTNSNGTYTVTYSASEITQILKNYGYSTADEAYADYNSLVLVYAEDYSNFTATIADLQVTGTVTSYYSSGDLVGTYSGGQKYTTTDDSGDTVEYIYTLDSDNDWSVAIANLPLSYTDTDGTVYYYQYYFVEVGDVTGVESKYTVYTTYSQDEGENGGGEIVVVNTLVETTEITVEKSWVDESGNSLNDSPSLRDANVTFELYYYLAYTDTDGTHYYNDGSSTSSDDDDDDSGDSGDSGGTAQTTTTAIESTGNVAIYLEPKQGSSNATAQKLGSYAYVPEGVTVNVSIEPATSNTYKWYQILYIAKVGSGTAVWENTWTQNDVSQINVSFTAVLSDTSAGDIDGFIVNWLCAGVGETVTLSFEKDGKTYTKTFTCTEVDSEGVPSAGVWDPSGNTNWYVTETEQNTATAASLGEEVNGIALTASSSVTVPIYFGAKNDIVYSNKPVTTASVPLGAEATIEVVMSNSTSWFGIYRYKDGSEQTEDNITAFGSNTYKYTISEIKQDYYVVDCIYGASIAEISINYTYDNEEVTLTCSDSDGDGEYEWTTPTSGGTTDPGGSTSTDTDASSATSYYVGEYTIVYDGNSDGTMDWSTVISDLPVYEIIGTTQYTRYYYVVETGTSVTIAGDTPLYKSAEYTNNDGITSGTITITNTVDETAIAYVMPSTISFDYTTMYEFGAMLILVSLVGAGTYRNISRTRKSLVEEPHRDGVDPGGTHERLPDVRNRKFVIPRIVRKGDTRAGPEVRQS